LTNALQGLVAAALACVAPLAAQPKDFIGAEACRPCHSSHFARQSATGHARALRRAMEHPLAARFTTTEPLLRPPNFHFSFATAADGLHVRADDGRFVIDLPIEWAFGAGEHAVTFVSRVSDEFYLEHSFSYFPGEVAFALTPRHDALRATTLNQAMGQPIRTQGAGATIVDCFGCHATGPVFAGSDGVMTVAEPGVHCESCHGPGGAHRSASAAKRLISKPSNLSSAELNRFCGKCHRSIAEGEEFDWGSPWSVRHQPPYLARSRCFQQSGGALSCLTCHDPHDRIRRGDVAYYRTRCVACHQAGKHPPAKICLSQKEPDCAGCHMPLVAAGANMSFKNHWIGIYPKGVALKPSR
jgi:hypothetical protein